MPFYFNSTTGTSGVTSITVSASSTERTTVYQKDYTLSNENGFSMQMPIVQRAYEPTEKFITMIPISLAFPSSGGNMTVQIRTNDNFELVTPDWLRVYVTGGTSGNTIIPFNSFENTGSSHSGSIVAYCSSDHSISAVTEVTQEGGYINPYINLGYYSMSASSESSTTSVTVTSNISWTTMTDSRWIDIDTESGSGNGNISFTINENTTDFGREGKITVFNYDYDIYAELIIRQDSSVKPYIELYPTYFIVDASGSTGNVISVSANCDYDITTDVAWIALDASSGSGFGSVSFSTLQNRNVMDAGNITFSNSAISRSVTVQRNEEVKYLSASTTSINVNLTGGTEEIEIYSNVDWEVAVENNWLSVSPIRGNGNGTLRVEIRSASENRYANIFVYNSNYGLSAEINVRQINGRVITYTSTNNRVVTPTNFPNVVSNTYENGVGTIVCSEDITEIPVSAFAISWSATTPSRLLTITIPESVERLNDFAFYNCTNLESANIPNSVTGIGRTFNMTNISAITIPHSVLELGGMGFAGCPLREIVLPNSLRSTGSYNFGGDPLVSVTIENGITELGAGNFGGCNILPLIEIPNSVAIIHERCFNNCTSLSAITIGTGMTEMRDSCFSGCSSLAVIYCHAVNAPILNGQDYSPYSNATFSDTPSNVVVHIPRGSSYPSWRSDTWAGRWTYIADL